MTEHKCKDKILYGRCLECDKGKSNPRDAEPELAADEPEHRGADDDPEASGA